MAAGCAPEAETLDELGPALRLYKMQAKRYWGKQQSDFRGMHAKHGLAFPFGALSYVG